MTEAQRQEEIAYTMSILEGHAGYYLAARNSESTPASEADHRRAMAEEWHVLFGLTQEEV